VFRRSCQESRPEDLGRRGVDVLFSVQADASSSAHHGGDRPAAVGVFSPSLVLPSQLHVSTRGIHATASCVDGRATGDQPAGVDRDRRATVAEQARSIAAAWSPPDAPPSWWLTAATFTAIAEDDELLGLAAAVPLDRLPPLVLSAAVRFHLDERGGKPLAAYYPRPGGVQPPPDEGFRPALRAFARSEAVVLARLCREHRYQMNEVGRCLDVVPALAAVAARDPRPLALVDLGTGAGLGLHLDRYHYTYAYPTVPSRAPGLSSRNSTVPALT
jgi:Uncharacterized protein conserved in bacteria (DUF2332)